MRKKYTGLTQFTKPKNCILLYNVEGDLTSQSRTRQEFSEEVDINYIIKRSKDTGQIASGAITNTRTPMYGDFGHIDFQTTQNTIALVKTEFSKLTAEERAKHQNNPDQWLKSLKADHELRITKKAEEEANKTITDEQKAINDAEAQKRINDANNVTTAA
jgi:hypothetical protein